MPKVVHLSNEIIRKLDQIRRRRRASYSEAIQWLLDYREDSIADLRQMKKEMDSMIAPAPPPPVEKSVESR